MPDFLVTSPDGKQSFKWTGDHPPTADDIAHFESQAPAMPAMKPVASHGGDAFATDPRFNTALSPTEETQFQAWKTKNAPRDSGADYDLRGAFKAGLTPDPKTGHWADTFKKPNHPTFSNQSKYAPLAPERAGRWEGDRFIPPATANKGMLGNPTKPASIRAGGGVMFEAIPQVTGAVGGMVGRTAGAAAGGTVGAVSVPGVGAVPGAVVGGATGAVAGAGTGGLLGRYAQYLLQRARGTGANPVGDFLGVPPLPQDNKSHSVIGELGSEATRQMTNEMGGEVIAAPLGFIQRGGWLKYSREAMTTLRENAAAGTKLSGPEIASGTATGDIAKGIQSYSAGAYGGGVMQRKVREEGTKNAMKALDDGINFISTAARTKVGAGQAAEAGLGAAKAGQTEVGKQMEAAAAKAGPVDMRAIKQEAIDEIQHSIVPRLATFPDVAGKPKIAQMIRQIRADPTLIQRLPRPAVTRLMDTIIEKTNSPALKVLRDIVGAEDDAPFKGVWDQAKVLGKGSTPDDQLYAKGDAQRIMTRFQGLFRDAMATTSPDFAQASATYRSGARVLESRAVRTILKTAVDKPEAVVALIKGNPTRAAQLQRALKVVAGRGPDAARASAAYDVIRSTYLQHQVVQGGKPMPITEAGFDKMLTSLSDRLSAEKQSGVLDQWFSDTRGKAVIANTERIADLMKKRSPVMAGNLRKIFELGRLMTVGVGLMTGHPNVSMATAATVWEAGPDFFIWTIHNPQATKWFIQGVQAQNPNVQAAATVRLFELYRTELQRGRSHAPSTSPSTPPAVSP